MKFKKILTFFSFIVIGLTNFSNSYSIEPDIFVQSTVNRASQILSQNLSKDQKIEELKSLAEETVDIKGIGMYTMGAYRKVMSESQKKEYEDRMEEKGWIDCMIITDETREQQKEYQRKKLKDTDGRIIGISNKRMGKD